MSCGAFLKKNQKIADMLESFAFSEDEEAALTVTGKRTVVLYEGCPEFTGLL